MNYLSVCSGIEAATVAWHDMGWKAVGYSEIEKFPSEVLHHHYPNVTNFGDMTKYKDWNINESVELLVGGTPCQSFSVAGLRKGLEDPRGNLALTYVGILDKFRPKWCVWENVPGVLSSGKGRDFGSFLGALVELGYGFAYRVLDAQHFGVAQRRRRVFVVGYFGDWKPAAKVLFESESLRRDIKKSKLKRETITPSTSPSLTCGFGKSSGQDLQPGLINPVCTDISSPLTARYWKGICSDDINPNATSIIAHVANKCATITSSASGYSRPGNSSTSHENYVAYALQGAGATSQNANGSGFKEEKAFTLNTTDVHGVAIGSSDKAGTLRANPGSGFRSDGSPVEGVAIQNMAVRRLTPIECERLQGFPDSYTNIKENCPDGPRYKALGNSMAVPVMRWIGQRINYVNDL